MQKFDRGVFTRGLNLFASSVLAGAVLAGVPALAEKYDLDKAHTNIGFAVKHFGAAKTRGKFNKYSGSLDFDPKAIDKTKVDVTIETSSIDTGDEKRDKHLKSDDFFDVAKFPSMTFKSREVKSTGSASAEVKGDLTLHGITKPVTLTVAEIAGPAVNPMDKANHMGATITGKINRKDFGLKFDAGGMKGIAGEAVVGDDVEINIDLEAATLKK